MTDRDLFLKALEENEDDVPTRMAYADWLEERGEVEEAERQRKYPEAKAWLVEFHRTWGGVGERRQGNSEESNWDYDWHRVSYDMLMLRAYEAAVVDKDYSFGLGPDEDLCDGLRQNHMAFWENWSIVTGHRIDMEKAEGGWFSCAC